MTESDAGEQVANLADAANKFSNSYGIELSKATETQSELLRCWLYYLQTHHQTGTADSLLVATESLVRECAASLSLGLVRSAIFSLRAQIDLVLAWIYFKDHPIEWTAVNVSGDGFKLKKELLEYIQSHNSGFGARAGILKQIARRSEVEPYRLLSAHIHGQSEAVLPVIVNLESIVSNRNNCIECANIAFEVSEYINDILVSIYSNQWHILPDVIKSSLITRFSSPQQRAEFFR